MDLRPYQQAAVDAVYEHLRTRDDNPCIVLPTGCHAKGHPILMYDGSVKKVEDIVVGDLLMGPDETPRRVLQLARGCEAMVKIMPVASSGLQPFVVNRHHLMPLYRHATNACDTECIGDIKPCEDVKFLHRRYSGCFECIPFTTEQMMAGDFYGFSLDGDHLYLDGNGVISHNTGKSLVLGKIASDAVSLWHGRVLILAHVKELLEQNADKVRKLCPELKVGVYSAGLKSRDTSESVIVAGIQSVYDKADRLGAFDLVVVDEAHLIAPEGDGMYRTFLKDMKLMNPLVRVIGLTATPFRLKGGAICKPENILNHVCYEAGLKEMIAQGYLSPLVSRAGHAEADLSSVHTKAGEFVQDELASAMDSEELVSASCEEIVRLTKDRKSVLVFCTSVEHCRHVAGAIRRYSGQECAVVTGSTSSGERAEIIARFRGKKIPADLWGTPKPPLKYLANVGVLTTGFDAPNTDCVVLMRPTQSAGLLLQMAGRGTRLSPATGKTNCLILDYGSNIMRHGPLDMIKVKEPGSGGHGGEAPVKKCPKCSALIAAGYGKCPECGYEFPPPERSNLTEHASNEGVLSGEVRDEEYDVHGVFYEPHVRRNADEGTPRTMRVDYEIGIGQYKSEWVCPEHTGYARQKFLKWWKERAPDGCPIPNTVDEAVSWARAGALAVPTHITVRWVTGEKFDRISKVVLGERPEMTDELMWQLENGPLTEPSGGMPAVEDDDIPF
ncbi:MAG: DEAD/DEAH box helicase family protein [Lentisphaeria bacterium]|nr:DEAD/DEAH box helicase family protein [Lentisphaeria bacterium]